MRIAVVFLVFCCTHGLHAEPGWRFTQGDWTVTFDAHGAVASLTNAMGMDLVRSGVGPCALEVSSPSGEREVIVQSEPVVQPLANGIQISDSSQSSPVAFVERTELVSIAGWPVLRRTVTVTPAASPSDKTYSITIKLGLGSARQETSFFVPRQDGIGQTVTDELTEPWAWALTSNPANVAPDQRLAIPMMSESAADAAVRVTTIADPGATTTFSRLPMERGHTLQVDADLGVLVLEQPITRTFWTVIHSGSADEAMKAWYATALADVPEGPDWLHDVAWQHYDYMSHGGEGWFEDIDVIEKRVAPEDRHRILFTLHGWYDLLGRYTYDAGTQQLDDAWTAFPNAPEMKDKGFPTSEPVPMTKAELHRRIKYAKDRGVRVALYFADGLTACEGAGRFAEDRVLFWGGWNGPDTIGNAYCQDPTHSDVFGWYVGYLKALLEEYGNELDAFVWDETFMVRAGMITPRRAYAAPAMMRLVKELTRTTSAFGKELAFLTSDCIGATGDEVNRWTDVPPYAIMAHGTYQDSHSRPSVWPYGIFPNYRNVLWSCNWSAVTRWDYTAFGVEHYDTPVATSNGWLDDKGIARLTDSERQAVLDLFAHRKSRRQELHWLDSPPPLFARRQE